MHKIVGGMLFGSWEVLGYEGQDRRHNGLYQCRCACGCVRVVLGVNLWRGKSLSCGNCGLKKSRLTPEYQALLDEYNRRFLI